MKQQDGDTKTPIVDARDEGLCGNEKIEEAIGLLQQQPSQELLAHCLTVLRHRMQEQGQFIVAVDAPGTDGQLQVQAMELPDGTRWLVAFTSFEEELRGNRQVMSTFLVDIDQLFQMAQVEPSVQGVLLNPWNRTIQLDKDLLGIIWGKKS